MPLRPEKVLPWLATLKAYPFLNDFRHRPTAPITIQRGQQIGLSGQSGIGLPHLHVSVEEYEKGGNRYVNFFDQIKGLIEQHKYQTKISRVIAYGTTGYSINPGATKSINADFEVTHISVSIQDLFFSENAPSCVPQTVELGVGNQQYAPIGFDGNFRYSEAYGYTYQFTAPIKDSFHIEILGQLGNKLIKEYRVEKSQSSMTNDNLFIVPPQKSATRATLPYILKNKFESTAVYRRIGKHLELQSWNYDWQKKSYYAEISAGGYFEVKTEMPPVLKASQLRLLTNQWGMKYLHINLPAALSGYKNDFIYLKGPLKNWQKQLDVEANILYLRSPIGDYRNLEIKLKGLEVFTRLGNRLGIRGL